MLEAQQLTKRYRDHLAVDSVSFKVEAGEVVGFLGPNGAGKTTTLRMLTGSLPPTSGTARLAGADVAEHPLAVKKRLGYLPEHPPLYFDLTGREYLRFVATLKLLPRREIAKEVQRVAELTGITGELDRLLRHLSKGYQQRVALAQALLGKPSVLVLDEPTVGLDPRQIQEVRGLLKQLAGEYTILLSTHILQEVVEICQRVVIINRGKVVADNTLQGLLQSAPEGPRARSLEQVFLSLTER